MLRGSLAVACFVVTTAVAVNPILLRLPFSDRARLGSALTAMQEPRGYYPDYPEFLESVREHTKRGDSICLVVPSTNWNSAYSHAYLRATYLLAGREVLPVITPDSRPAPQNLNRARYVAIWNVPGGSDLGRTVLEQHRGRLLVHR